MASTLPGDISCEKEAYLQEQEAASTALDCSGGAPNSWSSRTPTASELCDQRIAMLRHAAEMAGWEPQYITIDATDLSVKCLMKRLSDGLIVTLDGNQHRASLTSEYRILSESKYRGTRQECETYEFLSRRNFRSIRSAARAFRDYLVDNSTGDSAFLNLAVRGLLHAGPGGE